MTENSQIPKWIEPAVFENLLREIIPNFKNIQDFKVCSALAPGENYCTVMLKVQIEVMLRDETTAVETFMLKVPHNTELYRDHLSKLDVFNTEDGMYQQILPEMLKLYDNVGVQVLFTPQPYKLPTIKEEYILLEDLKRKGFRNARRQDCLDMEHCQLVLNKLAQWHAASAVLVEHKGPYDPKYMTGLLNCNVNAMLKGMMDITFKYLLETAKTLKNHELYYNKMENMSAHFMDLFFEKSSTDPDEFNVLNHGDCWSNNFMFKYDDEDGQLRDLYFVDLQVPRYGTPAQDLLYFILTSAKLDLKIKRFDEMIKYYHEHLIGNLKLLKYSKPIPTLGDLHKMLVKAGLWSLFSVWAILPVVLVDASNAATADSFVGVSDETHTFKELMYSNERIRQHYELLLPWLYYRGAFDME